MKSQHQNTPHRVTEDGNTLYVETEEKKKAPKMTFGQRLAAIKDALSMGAISQHDAREIKTRMGIGQAYFTRKQTSKAQRKKKRKAQTLARRANRGQRGVNRKGKSFRINNAARS
jgi:hypothetical protein